MSAIGIVVRKKENLKEAMDNLATRIGAFWNFEQFPVKITYEPALDRRSLSQNAQFHALCADIAAHFTQHGHNVTQDQIKELMKYKFLGTEDVVVGNTVISGQVRKTADLHAGEMSDLITQVMDWAFDHGVPVRNPHDGEYMMRRKESVS